MYRSVLLCGENFKLVERNVYTLYCHVVCCVNMKGFVAGFRVLSKSGARAGKISLPFSAERPIMNTGMPVSFLLSDGTDMF